MGEGATDAVRRSLSLTLARSFLVLYSLLHFETESSRTFHVTSGKTGLFPECKVLASRDDPCLLL